VFVQIFRQKKEKLSEGGESFGARWINWFSPTHTKNPPLAPEWGVLLLMNDKHLSNQ
jgi:hypothetical protein